MKRSQAHPGLCAVLLLGLLAPSGVLLGAPAEEFKLHLAEFAFDPLKERPSLPAGWDRASATQADLHLVQFDGPITEGKLALLHGQGLAPQTRDLAHINDIQEHAQDGLIFEKKRVAGLNFWPRARSGIDLF